MPLPSGPSYTPIAAPALLDRYPVVREVERHLAEGDRAAAVRSAFPLVMVDVQRAYGTHFPTHWTSRDVLAHGLRPDMGRLPDLLLKLHALYEPVRFGEPRDWVEGDVAALVRAIYTETSLRSLLEAPAIDPRLAPAGGARSTALSYGPAAGGA